MTWSSLCRGIGGIRMLGLSLYCDTEEQNEEGKAMSERRDPGFRGQM